MTSLILPIPKSVSLHDLAVWNQLAVDAGVDRIWLAKNVAECQQMAATKELCSTDAEVAILCSPNDISRNPAFLQAVSSTVALIAATCEEDLAVGLKTDCLEHAATLGASTLDGIVVGLSLSNKIDFRVAAGFANTVRKLPELTTVGIIPRDIFLRQVIDRYSARGSHSGSEHANIATTALQAGLLLLSGYVEESHAASQSIEGEGLQHTGDYWHAILHRREPDYENAKYWFRHVGRHPNFGRLAELIPSMLKQTTGPVATELGRWASRLITSHGWDAFAFVDFCQAAERHAELRALGDAIQWTEMLLLIESSFLAAAA
ncbi:MAG: hypothetical protein WCJ09_07350 [Planctomycetota bacterium]